MLGPHNKLYIYNVDVMQKFLYRNGMIMLFVTMLYILYRIRIFIVNNKTLFRV